MSFDSLNAKDFLSAVIDMAQKHEQSAVTHLYHRIFRETANKNMEFIRNFLKEASSSVEKLSNVDAFSTGIVSITRGMGSVEHVRSSFIVSLKAAWKIYGKSEKEIEILLDGIE